MSVTDYTTKVKEICDALGFINVTVDEDVMVHICLGCLAQRYGPIWTAIYTQEKPPSFFDLQLMLIVAKNHVSGSRTTHSDSWMLYTKAELPRGHGGQGGSARNSGGRQEQESRHRGNADNSSGPSTSRGIHGGAENRQTKAKAECWYCGKKVHKESECWKKRADSEKNGLGSGRTEQGNGKRSHYAVVVKKTVQGRSWSTKAWEPALHARARQGELGT